MAQKEIQLTIKGSNAIEIDKKERALKKYANLAPDDQERVEAIIESPKALKGLKENWNMLQSMFGV